MVLKDLARTAFERLTYSIIAHGAEQETDAPHLSKPVAVVAGISTPDPVCRIAPLQSRFTTETADFGGMGLQ